MWELAKKGCWGEVKGLKKLWGKMGKKRMSWIKEYTSLIALKINLFKILSIKPYCNQNFAHKLDRNKYKVLRLLTQTNIICIILFLHNNFLISSHQNHNLYLFFLHLDNEAKYLASNS